MRTPLPDLLAPHVASGEIPGLVALVAWDGDVQVEAIGRLRLGGSAIGRDAIFRISSMTKPIVGAATMSLVEDGVLGLDDAVDPLLPELADRRVLTRIDAPLDDTVPARRPITVRDLLTFRMGLGIVLAPPGSYPVQRAMAELSLAQGPPGSETPPEPDEWLRRLGTLPLLHQPGERWMYGTGSDVLGVLLARATGQPLGEVLRGRVLDPLGMRDTGFHVPARSLARFVTAYRAGDDGLVVSDEPASGAWSHEPDFSSGAGGLVSTVDDYLAFGEMLHRGGAGVLSAASVAQLIRNQLDAGQGDGIILPEANGWGFGVATGPAPGRYGWAGGLGSSWDAGPGSTAILLTQLEWGATGPPAVFGEFWAATQD